MTTRIYGPISQVQIDQFLQQAPSHGLTVTPTNESAGEVTGLGTKLDYIYDPTTQRVTLNLIGHPPFLELKVWQKLEGNLPTGIVRILT